MRLSTLALAGALALTAAPLVHADVDLTVLHEFQATPPHRFQGGLIQASDGLLYGTSFDGGYGGVGTVFKINPTTGALTVLKAFVDENGPYGGLIEGADGALYGTTSNENMSGGTIFKVNRDGTGFHRLHFFLPGEGAQPSSSLLQTADGTLFGTTFKGGSSDAGTIFKINPDGSGFATLHTFNGTNGRNPYAGLVQGPGGVLYGAAAAGGAHGAGVVFKIDPDGSDYLLLHAFAGPDGGYVYGGLLIGADGRLYGTTDGGGSGDVGTVFAMATDGGGFVVLHHFAGTDGSYPDAALIQAPNGTLYGTTFSGGTEDSGTIFKLNPDGSGFGLVLALSGGRRFPQSSVVRSADGKLFGATTDGPGEMISSLFRVNENGSGFTALFDANAGVAANPKAAILLSSDGILYSSTVSGGQNSLAPVPSERGTLFKVSPTGTGFQTLHHFDRTTGETPIAALLEGSDGLLYGAATAGGASGAGTLFRSQKSGSGFTLLHEFDWNDGGGPSGTPIQGADGLIYGTATGGGASGSGVVYRLDPDGSNFTILHDFSFTDGAYPVVGLKQATDSRLYGTTIAGGANGVGTVFGLDPDGTDFALVHEFDTSGGFNPLSAVLEGPDGRLYGTAVTGGPSFVGTIYRVNKDGSGFETIHEFEYNADSGRNPQAALIFGTAGFLYGTTTFGGANDLGTAFRLSGDGSQYAKLYDFNFPLGGNIQSALTLGPDGDLLGTAFMGGSGQGGTVYRLRVDSDDDGILDPADNCPPYANADQADTDDNGLGDVCQLPTLSVGDVTVTEGNAGTTNAVFTVALSAASADTVTVQYATAPGSAASPADFTAVNATVLTFTPGQTSKTVTVKVKGDTKDEDDETFSVTLTNPSHANVADGQGVGTISDDDAVPALSVADLSTAEGSSNKQLTVTVKLTPASGRSVSVNYTTVDGSATGGSDFTPASGILTFDPGQTSKTFKVTVNGDTSFETDETFSVVLSGAPHAAVPGPATVTLTNDDPAPVAVSASIDDVTLSEGQSGSTSFVFTVTLSAAPTSAVSVAYATANGSAVAPGDFTNKAASLTFNAGQTSKTISVPVKGDKAQEANETFFVSLSDAVGLTISDSQGVGTIQNDDAPTISIADKSVTEGNSGMKNLSFTVTLSGAALNTVTVQAQTSAGTATAGDDYTETAGTVTFTPGQTSRTFVVPVKGDTLDEENETLVVNLSAPTNATIADGQATGTIVDNDSGT